MARPGGAHRRQPGRHRLDHRRAGRPRPEPTAATVWVPESRPRCDITPAPRRCRRRAHRIQSDRRVPPGTCLRACLAHHRDFVADTNRLNRAVSSASASLELLRVTFAWKVAIGWANGDPGQHDQLLEWYG